MGGGSEGVNNGRWHDASWDRTSWYKKPRAAEECMSGSCTVLSTYVQHAEGGGIEHIDVEGEPRAGHGHTVEPTVAPRRAGGVPFLPHIQV